MPTLRLRFPGGRYHATPWGHHVNEGQIEWPPSPWRLLRALIACGFTKQGWEEIPPTARKLFEKLAGTLPSYRLPTASAAHSRHFMPIGSIQKGREKTTLVFDTWANLGTEPLDVHWDCALTDDETVVLRQLAECLGYLGRSESWVEAQLLQTESSVTDGFNAFPHREGLHPGAQWEQISLLAPVSPETYANWQRTMTDQIAACPRDLLDCLMKDTAWWKKHRWSQPPGSQRVIYWRRSDSLEVGPPERAMHPEAERVTMMLLALTTPSGNRSALPPCNRALPQAELLHRAIVGRVARGKRADCPELTGRDEHGRPLRNGHLHAHILPVDLDADGHLDHIIVYAPMGLGEAAQRAIRAIRQTWTKRGVGELQVALAGAGDLEGLRTFNHGIERLIGPAGGSRTWESETPFVPPRFVKRRGTNTLTGQINAELASRSLPSVEEIKILPWTAETLALRHFIRRRQRGGTPPPVDVGYALRLRFAEPIVGPLTLGYASHFGLGLFKAIEC